MNSFFMSLLMVPPSEDGGGNPLMTFLPLILIIGIFYFLIIRPQSKKQKETQKMISALKKGDRVVTIGGIHGIIQSVRENTVILKVDESVKLEFNRGAISSVTSQAKEDKEERKALEVDDDDEESGDDDK